MCSPRGGWLGGGIVKYNVVFMLSYLFIVLKFAPFITTVAPNTPHVQGWQRVKGFTLRPRLHLTANTGLFLACTRTVCGRHALNAHAAES